MTKNTLFFNPSKTLVVAVGFFLFAVYLFCYRGGFHSVDEVSMFAVTESLVKFGTLNTDQIAWTQWTVTQAEAQGFFGPDGHVYSKKGLAISLFQAPLYALALVIPGLGMLQTVSLLNALLTAVTGALVTATVIRLGFAPRTGAMAGLFYGLATIAGVYAKYLFSETLAGFLLLAAFYSLLIYRQRGGRLLPALAGFLAGLTVLARANNLLLLGVLGLYLLAAAWQIHRSARLKMLVPLSAFVAGAALAGAIFLWYNRARSGNPLQTGYDLSLFSPNILLGLYKLLFSPLRGLFVYSPALILAIPGWFRLRKTHPAVAWLCAGIIGLTVLLFSAWSSGEGLAWGSRFLVPVVPFLVIAAAPIIESSLGLRPSSVVVWILIILSVAIQILGVSINPWVHLGNLQTQFGGQFFLEKTAALYDFSTSQIAGQLQNWRVDNSDLIWWQPGQFDGLAFTLGALAILLTGLFLWRSVVSGQRSAVSDQQSAVSDQQSIAGGQRSAVSSQRSAVSDQQSVAGGQQSAVSSQRSAISGRRSAVSGQQSAVGSQWSLPFTIHYSLFTIPLFLLALTFFLLTRYYHTDTRQFGPLDSGYEQALTQAAQASAGRGVIITAAQYSYHVPMNRFKAKIPLIGFAQSVEPLPDSAYPLLQSVNVAGADKTWLVTQGWQPADPINRAEEWLAQNAFKAADVWFPGAARLVSYGLPQPGQSVIIGQELGRVIRLVGADFPARISAGAILPVTLTWQALASPPADYAVFGQLLDQTGALVAQQDGPPQGGYRPAGAWIAGEMIVDRRGLVLPANLPPGTYRLIAGLYNPADGLRLTTPAGADFVELGVVSRR